MLQMLPVQMEQNILRGALRAGANVFKVEARLQLASHGNVESGLLSKGLSVTTRARAGTVTASLKAKGKHGFIAHWIEFGTEPHAIRGRSGNPLAFGGDYYKMINHPGITAHPFFRPTIDGKSGEALVAIGEYIKLRLTKEGLNTREIEIVQA